MCILKIIIPPTEHFQIEQQISSGFWKHYLYENRHIGRAHRYWVQYYIQILQDLIYLRRSRFKSYKLCNLLEKTFLHQNGQNWLVLAAGQGHLRRHFDPHRSGQVRFWVLRFHSMFMLQKTIWFNNLIIINKILEKLSSFFIILRGINVQQISRRTFCHITTRSTMQTLPKRTV